MQLGTTAKVQGTAHSCSSVSNTRHMLAPAYHGSMVRRSSFATAASSSSQTEAETEMQGLSRDYCYCDNFVCTSSPQIESTVRALARDLERCNGVWTKSLFSRNVEYKDTFRSFKGLEGYSRLNFISKKLSQPSVTVQKLQMLDIGTALINWNLRGNLGPTPIDVDMETEIAMNLLTGQIEKHSERWNLKRCSPPASTAWTLNRILWSIQTAGSDASEATNSLLDSLTSMDEGDSAQDFSQNPNDPMRFFQQKDAFKDDAIFFLGFMALVWAVFQAYNNILSSS